MRTFGAGLYRGAWETSDGSCPWPVFWILLDQLPALRTLERLTQAAGVTQGIGIAFGGDAGELERELRAVLRGEDPDRPRVLIQLDGS